MALAPTVACCVNAGGDLRVAGPGTERVLLRVAPDDGMVPVVEIENGSLASSSGIEHRRQVAGAVVGPHVDPAGGHAMGTETFVSVIAPNCVDADALTKVVLALGEGSAPVLTARGATAYLKAPDRPWQTLGTGA
jgi:thiamine biosynthesis lipoprotein